MVCSMPNNSYEWVHFSIYAMPRQNTKLKATILIYDKENESATSEISAFRDLGNS